MSYRERHLEGSIETQREELKKCIDHWNGGHIMLMYSNFFYDNPDDEEDEDEKPQEERLVVRGGPKSFPSVPVAMGPSTREILYLLRLMPLDERERLFDRLLDSEWMVAAIFRYTEKTENK